MLFGCSSTEKKKQITRQLHNNLQHMLNKREGVMKARGGRGERKRERRGKTARPLSNNLFTPLPFPFSISLFRPTSPFVAHLYEYTHSHTQSHI